MTVVTLSKLPASTDKRKRRIGRGHGSGRVKTSGRGTKGQNARGTMKPGFEGGQLPIIKRLPLLRGKGKNKSLRLKTFPIPVERLNVLPKGAEVTVDTLRTFHIIGMSVASVKVLGGGKLETKLSVRVPCSASAKQAIEKAGGTVLE